MQFLCDVHTSIKISKHIEKLGYHSTHVNQILNKWYTKDNDITNYTDKNDLILITKDQDFKNSFLLNYKPKKIIKINLGNISNEELLEMIEAGMENLKSLNDQSIWEIHGGDK